MAGPTTPNVHVGYTAARTDTGRLCVTCELFDNTHEVEALAPVPRSGRFGFDSPESAAERARLMCEALSHQAL